MYLRDDGVVWALLDPPVEETADWTLLGERLWDEPACWWVPALGREPMLWVITPVERDRSRTMPGAGAFNHIANEMVNTGA